MQRFFSNVRHPVARKLTATWLAVIFALGFTSSFLHLQVQEHVYCVEHDQVTHDAEHAADSRQALTGQTATLQTDSHQPQPEDSPDSDGDNCLWLAWMATGSISYPDLQPELLNLPPPADREAATIPHARRLARNPIATERISPINSPPRV